MQETQIRVKRPDGTIDTITKAGTITSPEMRRKMADATRNAGKGEIIGWAIVGEAPQGPKLNIYQRLAIEDQKARDIAAGRCPKCHTWCNGDCN